MAALLCRGRGLFSGAAARFSATSAVRATPSDTPKVIASFPNTKPHAVVDCKSVNGGRQLSVEFADGTRYEVHASWLRDSAPTRAGADYYRKSATDVWGMGGLRISCAESHSGGERLSVEYEGVEVGPAGPEVFEAKWLHSLAPFVGKAMHDGAGGERFIQGTGSLMDRLLGGRTPWYSGVEIPAFDARHLESDLDAQVQFYEAMICPGVAMVHGVGTPDSLEMKHAGAPLEAHCEKILGRLNQHPVRSTRYAFMQKMAQPHSLDYDHSNPLSMHTDHAVYHGTPGFLQFLHQAQGHVRSKVADGLALAEHMRLEHPDAYELLTTVNITHSSRNELYTADGSPRNPADPGSRGVPFELVHTHPIIVLDGSGRLEKVVQSETKRGVCALPFSVYEPFMEAYRLWSRLCEDPRFVHHFDWPEGSVVVTNNWRTLHGRATVRPEAARTLCIGYANRALVENRYRLLKQRQAERADPALDHRWLTRVPNQALERMVL